MNLDFCQGYKMLAGLIVLVLALLGHQLSEGEVLETITAIGQAVGAIITAYGLTMKIVRKYKK